MLAGAPDPLACCEPVVAMVAEVARDQSLLQLLHRAACRTRGLLGDGTDSEPAEARASSSTGAPRMCSLEAAARHRRSERRAHDAWANVRESAMCTAPQATSSRRGCLRPM
eukprot:6019856-Prymnesium_polylepis.1